MMRILLSIVVRARNFAAAFAAGSAARLTATCAREFRIAGIAPRRVAFIPGDSRRKKSNAGSSCRPSAVKSRTMGALEASNHDRTSRKRHDEEPARRADEAGTADAGQLEARPGRARANRSRR